MTTKTTDSRLRFRCSPVTAKLGSPGSRPCRFTSIPSTITPVSSNSATTPVARLAYHKAVTRTSPREKGNFRSCCTGSIINPSGTYGKPLNRL